MATRKKTGRPTKLTPELIKQAREFLEERIADRKLLPTIEGLALHLKISRETIYVWAEEPGEFSDIVSDLKNAQAEKLMQNSLNNQYNATIAKLILSGKHGYVEKSEVDQNVSGNVSFVNDVPRPGRDGDASSQGS